MTGYRRLSILAVTAVLVAGCGANPATTIPTASPAPAGPGASVLPSPIPSAKPSAEPTGEPAATDDPDGSPEPNLECPAATPTDQPGVWLSSDLARSQPVVEITRMARVAEPDKPLPLPRIERPASFVSFVGGRRADLALFYIDYDWPFGWMITKLDATLTMDGRKPVDLDVELAPDSMGNASGASVRIPDRDGTGTLDVQLAWYDSCFTYEGRVSTPVRIYPESSVAGCPTGRVAAFDELAIAFDPPIVAGGTSFDLHPWDFAGKVRDMAVIDPLPPYVGFDADTPVLAAGTGQTITVVHDNPAVRLELMDKARVTFYERAPLLRWLDAGWIHGDEPAAPVVFRSKLIANPDGTFAFTMPPEPGRYAAEVTFWYDAACSLGSAGFVMGIDAA